MVINLNMAINKNSRRKNMRDYFGYEKQFRFAFPLDGDCLNIYDGEIKGGFLTIPVKVKAPINADIWIDEIKAEYCEKCGMYTAQIALRGYRNTIIAENRSSGEIIKAAVYKLREPVGKFRISVDDNILFLQDIAEHQNIYSSVFDNPYLAIYKKAHDLYGAKVHMNLYYEFTENDMQHYSGKRRYFNLTMMPDKYKSEFLANSDWLKFSFHARANLPDKPYETTSIARITEDIELVEREIERFAGREMISHATTLHWGASNENGVRALRQHGYKGLNGYFDFDSNGKPLVSYFYPNEIIENFQNRDFWVDNDENVIYSKVDMVLNSYKLENVIPKLEKIYDNPHIGGFVELLIHEQYFHKDYISYIPEYAEIILTAAKWLHDRGYKGSHLSEVEFE